MKTIKIIIGLAACYWLCGAGVGLADDMTAVREFLEGCAQKWDTIETLHQKAELRREYEYPGSNFRSLTMSDYEFFYRKPDDVVMKTPQQDFYQNAKDCIFVPKRIFSDREGTNTYTRMTKLEWENDADMTFTGSWGDATPDQVYLFHNAASRPEVIGTFLENLQGRLLPDEDWNGRLFHVLVLNTTFRIMSWGNESWSKCYIDPDTGLFTAIELIEPPEWAVVPEASDVVEDCAPDGAAAEILERMKPKAFYTVLSSQLNEPIPDDAFAFVPPDGYIEKTLSDVEDSLPEGVVDISRQDISGGRGDSFERFEHSGQPAPDFELALLDGGTFKLSEARGKVVVIDFWATWCGPYLRALPKMQRLSKRYADNPNVLFLGVNTEAEKKEKTVREVMQKNAITFSTGMDESAIKQLYGVGGIPCVVVINPEGIIQGRLVGFSDRSEKVLTDTIDKLLAGETLESAVPMTEEELAALGGICENCGQRHKPKSNDIKEEVPKADLNAEFFKMRWNIPMGKESSEEERRFSSPSDKCKAYMIPNVIVHPSETELKVLDIPAGEVIQTLTLPENIAGRNARRQLPSWTYLRHPDGDYVVGHKRLYKRETRPGGSESYSTRGSLMVGVPMDEKNAVWTMSVQWGDEPFAWTISAEEDVLVEPTSSSVKIYNARGTLLLEQMMERSVISVDFFYDTTPFVIISTDEQIACYDWIYSPVHTE